MVPSLSLLAQNRFFAEKTNLVIIKSQQKKADTKKFEFYDGGGGRRGDIETMSLLECYCYKRTDKTSRLRCPIN